MSRARTPLIAAAAGGLLVAGSLLPWLTLYAGLRSLDGTTGSYGRVLLGLGIACLLVAAASWWRVSDGWRWATGLLGAAAAYPSARAVLGLRATADLDPLLAAAPGPGPWVALAGAVLAFALLFLRPGARTAEHLPAGSGQDAPLPG